MELLQLLQLCVMFIIFALTLLFVLLPLKLMPSDREMLRSRNTRRLLDLCHSFSAGVFLGTCFVQLLPHAEETMEVVQCMLGIDFVFTSGETKSFMYFTDYFAVLEQHGSAKESCILSFLESFFGI